MNSTRLMKTRLQKIRQAGILAKLSLTNDRPSPTPAIYLAQIDPVVQASFTAQQRAEVARVIDLAIPKPAPKLVDLRFNVDLLISRYFIVLMVGKDRRRAPRDRPTSRLTQFGNWFAAIVLLLGFNLTLSISLFMLAYLIKSALGIDLLPGHFRGFGK